MNVTAVKSSPTKYGTVNMVYQVSTPENLLPLLEKAAPNGKTSSVEEISSPVVSSTQGPEILLETEQPEVSTSSIAQKVFITF